MVGCSGYNYNLEFIKEESIDQEEDLVSKIDRLTFVMDIFSKEYLKGTTLDYVSSLKESGFKFENPQSKKTCGCRIKFFSLRNKMQELPIYTKQQVLDATLSYFKNDEIATDVFLKYCLQDRESQYRELTPDDMHKRLAKEFARIER